MIAKEMIAEKVFAEGVAKDIRNFLPAKYENAEFQVMIIFSQEKQMRKRRIGHLKRCMVIKLGISKNVWSILLMTI